MTKHDGDLEQDFIAELTALAEHQEAIELVIRPGDAWIMLSAIQLAWRMEALSQDFRDRLDYLGRRLQSLVASSGALAVVAERGWQSEHDVEAQQLRRERDIANDVAEVKQEMPKLRKDVEQIIAENRRLRKENEEAQRAMALLQRLIHATDDRDEIEPDRYYVLCTTDCLVDDDWTISGAELLAVLEPEEE